jgi:hypothetical protein
MVREPLFDTLRMVGVLAMLGCRETPAPSVRTTDAGTTEAGASAAVSVRTPSSAHAASSSAHTPSEPQTAFQSASQRPEASSSAQALSDAGAGLTCRSLGRAAVPYLGPAQLVERDAQLLVVINESGGPGVLRMPIPPADVALTPSPFGSVVERRGFSPSCEVSGPYVYCADAAGSLTRASLANLGGTRGSVPPLTLQRGVAKVLAGSRFAAARTPDGQTVLAFLRQRQAQEPRDAGLTEAWAQVDGEPPVRLSEDGNGATSIALESTTTGVRALYLDGRSAMTPVHLRAFTFTAPRPGASSVVLQADAVIHIAGPAEPSTRISWVPLGPAAKAAVTSVALLPSAADALRFGLFAWTLPAVVPPAFAASPTFSLYPNGLDPAPVAATSHRSQELAWVVRVRPESVAPTATHVAELGTVDGAARVQPLLVLGAVGAGAHVSVLEDTTGAVWTLRGDATQSMLERWRCVPSARR